MIVRRPRNEPGTTEIGWAGEEIAHILTAANHASNGDMDLLTKTELADERRKRREALARKRPCGFGAWPEEAS